MSLPLPGCRVLHLGHSIRVGGKERVLLGLAAAGREAGHDDRVLVFDHPPGEPHLEIDPGQVPVDFLARGRGLDLRYVRRLARYLTASGARVVHAHNDSALVYAVLAAALARRPRPRVLATLHNAPSHPTPMARRLTRWCAARAHGVTCVSHELRDHLMHRGWIAQATVTPNGVDLLQFQPEGTALDLHAQLALPKNALLVGMPARLGPGKRFEDLASALTLAPGGRPRDWIGIIAGEGPERPRVQALVDSTDGLHLMPHQRNMPAFLRGLDAVCLFSDHEGQPMTILEAMACARPVLASAVGGLPALLEDGVQAQRGILVPKGNAQAIAGALQSLIDPSFRSQLAMRGHQYVVAHHALSPLYSRDVAIGVLARNDGRTQAEAGQWPR